MLVSKVAVVVLKEEAVGWKVAFCEPEGTRPSTL
jgi:hypothetical protein